MIEVDTDYRYGGCHGPVRGSGAYGELSRYEERQDGAAAVLGAATGVPIYEGLILAIKLHGEAIEAELDAFRKLLRDFVVVDRVRGMDQVGLFRLKLSGDLNRFVD